MHEMALCQGILDIIRDRAAEEGFDRVAVVHLCVGALSHVDPHALEFGFDAVTRGTLAEGAELKINRPAGQAFCMACSQTVTLAARGEACPACGSHQLMVVAGDELRVEELEVS
ncbi:hydrogenase maturation nickel metallochaperone HypA [Skermanella sp. TT6]|uniref:Hydrogenase maturation factor HypA n=2 Tax=Skermanella cutis TaxID=2775420 RepID=A0ABX7B9J4_9PROT|nr:hydrogenase maturation nickel metallochaperone HypA [Skermanella sp. TT6]